MATFKKRLMQMLDLSWNEWRYLVLASMLLPAVAMSLNLQGYNRTRQLLARINKTGGRYSRTVSESQSHAETIIRMVSIASTHGLYRASCLKRALVQWWLLTRKGIQSEIRFGVKQDEEMLFGAHAWIECPGLDLADIQRGHQPYLKLEHCNL